MGIVLGGNGCVDVAEDVVEFADRGEFDRFSRGEGISFFLVEECLEPIAEFVGEFEESEVVDLLEAESLGEDAGGFEESGHGEDFGWLGRS
jgi:hypothetical protein